MLAQAIGKSRFAATLVILAACAAISPDVQALRLTGIIDASSSDGGSGTIAFNCEGENPCRGEYISVFRNPGCPRDEAVVDTVVLVGLNLSTPAPIAGTITLASIDGPGNCSNQPGTRTDVTLTFSGNWNGTRATLAFAPVTEGAVVTTLAGRLAPVSELVEITGSFAGAGTSVTRGSFSCQGTNPCIGYTNAVFQDPGCSNSYAVSDRFAISGLDLSAPGAISGNLAIRHANQSSTVLSDGSCAYREIGARDGSARFTGQWNGTNGTLQFLDTDYPISGGFTFTTRPLSTAPPPPVFPMTVTTDITDTTARATASIQFRPQDVGTTGSVYTFAIAPQSQVRPAANGETAFVMGKSSPSNGAKDTPVACVLAQLTASGQLQATSIAGLQSLVNGLLSAAGQTVPVIGGVPTGNVAGATFYVGYGSNSTSMISGGINRGVVTVPGSQVCQPQAPQTGWWWNASESGRGYTIEVSGRNLFFAAYLYDTSGRSLWHISAGPTSLDGSLYIGNLERYENGQTLDGPYKPPSLPPASAGSLMLAFNSAQSGTITWPGGIVAITRSEFGTGGVNAVAQANQPEKGWWWNPAEGGRGFFIEWQAGVAFMAGFMYESDGHPAWYVSAAGTPNPRTFSGSWDQYANGQTIAGAYRRPDLVRPGFAPVTIRFTGARDGFMTLPGGREIPVTRQAF